jgi:hypothetical protein
MVTDDDGDGLVPVVLDGTSSSDPDGDPMKFTWQTSNGTVLATIAAATVDLPVGTHAVVLIVTDE